MKYAGIDYSITGPAICVFDDKDGEPDFKVCRHEFMTTIKKFEGPFPVGAGTEVNGRLFPPYDNNEERFDAISEWAMDILIDCDVIFMEGYAYSRGSKGMVFNIAENGGVLKHKLWRHGKEFTVVTPGQVKKLATGKGNAKKPDMNDALAQKSGIDVFDAMTPDRKKLGSPTEDIVDAYYVMLYGYMSYNKLL